MTGKHVVTREQVRRDIEDAVEHYALEAGEGIALTFINMVEGAFRAIAEHPAIGSPRYAYELDLPGLRVQPLKRYPYLVFYVERADHLDVWRVLHAQRDIPALMRGPGEAWEPR